MKAILIVFLSVFSSICFGQSIEASMKLFEPEWLPGVEQDIESHTILKKEGHTGNYGWTNIRYITMEQELAQTEQSAKEELWTAEYKAKHIKTIKSLSSGGQLIFVVGRLTQEAADLNWFTLILKDADGKEVFRKKMKPKTARMPSRGKNYWTNISSTSIPKPIATPFYVYIIDEMGIEEGKQHVFVVKN